MGQPFRTSGECLWGARRRKIRKQVIARHGMVCCICDEPIVDEASVTMDHVVAARDGGLFRTDNLRPAHDQCNKAKGYEDVRRRKAAPEPSPANSRKDSEGDET